MKLFNQIRIIKRFNRYINYYWQQDHLYNRRLERLGTFLALKLNIYKVEFLLENCENLDVGYFSYSTYGTIWSTRAYNVDAKLYTYNQGKEIFLDWLRKDYYLPTRVKKLLKMRGKEIHTNYNNKEEIRIKYNRLLKQII